MRQPPLLWIAGLAACGTPDPAPVAVAEPDCGVGEIADGEVCVPEACGAGTWGDLPVEDGTVFVDAGAPEGGDGTEGAPLRTVQSGADLAGSMGGGLVLIAAGTYPENVVLDEYHDGVALMGRCAGLVTMDAGGNDWATIDIAGDTKRTDVELQGVTVTGGGGGGLSIDHARVTLRDVEVLANALFGLVVFDSSEVVLDGVTVSSTRTDDDGEGGFGVYVAGGSQLDATGCTIQGNKHAGVGVIESGTVVSLVDTEVLDSLPTAEGLFGQGVVVGSGGAVTMTRCTLLGNTNQGVYASDEGTVVELVDTHVGGTSAGPDGTGGFGLQAEAGATMRATGCSVEGNTACGVLAYGEGTAIELVETTVGGTLASADGTLGHGINVEEGAMLSAVGCTVQGNNEAGVVAYGAGSAMTLDTTTVSDTQPGVDGAAGHGIEVQQGGSVVATGCTIQGNSGGGVVVSGAGSVVDLDNTSVLDTLQTVDGVDGYGVYGQGGASIRISASTIQGNSQIGLAAVDAETFVSVDDTAILDTWRGRDAAFSIGLAAEYGAQVSMDGVELSGNEGPGVYAIAEGAITCTSCDLVGNAFAGVVVTGATVTLSDSTIAGTLPDAELGGGFGIYATSYFGAATVTLSDSTVGPHAYAAIWLDGNGTFVIGHNAIAGSDGVSLGAQSLHGNAVFAENGVTAFDGTLGLQLNSNSFSDAGAIAVLLDASSATMDSNTFVGNETDVWQQRCDGVQVLGAEDLGGAAVSSVCPEGNVLTAYDLSFSTLFLPSVETEE